MNADDLQRLLRQRFPVEDERHEWKGWSALKHNVSGKKGEDLLCYVSALANMDGGCIVIGAQDGSLRPTGIADPGDYTPENLPHRLLGSCANLPSLGLHVEALRAEDTGAVVWLLHVPRRFIAFSNRWQERARTIQKVRQLFDSQRNVLRQCFWAASIVRQSRGGHRFDDHPGCGAGWPAGAHAMSLSANRKSAHGGPPPDLTRN